MLTDASAVGRPTPDAGRPTQDAVVRSSFDRAMSWLIRGKRQAASQLLLLPTTIWLLFFLVIPLVLLLAVSFVKRGAYGALILQFTLANYHRAFSPSYLPILVRTFGFASATTFACLLLGYPFAYFLSQFVYSRRARDFMLVVLMLPFWTSFLVQIYSWMIILGREGLLNNALIGLGLISEPIQFLNTRGSLLLGLTYSYLPFMILPLYSSLSKLPRSYIEASKDLGAGNIQTFLKITLPLSLPGVMGGIILTFIPCMGDFLTAEFLGGPKTYLIGNLIQNQFYQAADYPFGSALSAVLLILLFLGLLSYRWVENLGATNLGRSKG